MSNEPSRAATEAMNPPAHSLAADLAWMPAGGLPPSGTTSEARAALVNRAMVRACAIAVSAGARITGFAAPDVVEIERDGGPMRIVVLANTFSPHPMGTPRDVARLVDAIAGSLGEWRFMVHIKRTLPAGFDPEPVARAVSMWRTAMDRGEWSGKHAVYEDELVAIELTVTDKRDSGGPIGVVGLLPAPDRLLGVYDDVRTRVDALSGNVPFIVAASAEPAWSVPRGCLIDLLYGTPDLIDVSDAGWVAVFARRHPALLGDKRISAVWWIEGDAAGLAFHAQAFESPWRPPVVTFPGTRYSSVDAAFARVASRQSEKDRVAVRRTGHAPTEWRLA